MLLILTRNPKTPSPMCGSNCLEWMQETWFTALHPHPTNIKSKYENKQPHPSLMVSVCMLSLQHTTLLWPWCLFLVLFSPSSPVTTTTTVCSSLLYL